MDSSLRFLLIGKGNSFLTNQIHFINPMKIKETMANETSTEMTKKDFQFFLTKEKLLVPLMVTQSL